MAEAVVFPGSPLHQYLRDVQEPHVAPQDGDLSEASTSGAESQYASSLAETASASRPAEDSAAPTSTITPRSTYLDSCTNTNPATVHPTTSRHAGSDRTSHSPASKSDNQPSITKAEKQVNFFLQLTTSLRALLQHLLLPLVIMIAPHVFAMQQSSEASMSTGPYRQVPSQPTSTSTDQQSHHRDKSFAERFKYAICSSFLLTPSLSISFYETSPPFETQQPAYYKDAPRPGGYIKGQRPSPLPIHKQCYVEPLDAPASILPNASSSTAVHHQRLPRLDTQGRRARNAAFLAAIFLIPPTSKSWQAWFSTLLLITSLTWAFILFLTHTSPDDSIHFSLSRQASPALLTSAASLRNLSTSNEPRQSHREAIRRSALKNVSNLIRAAQQFDLSINKAISAIQEVEIVSRGYKLTHPLPPISRIEAATSHSPSPSRQRRSMAAPILPPTAKLTRTLSGGGIGAPTIKRHTQRPLSLTLSNGRASPFDRPSGRASPAISNIEADLDLTQKLLAEQSTAALASGISAPHRILELRKSVIAALQDVGAACTTSTASLQILADPEELALLYDLYALDASTQEDANQADLSLAWTNGETSAFSDDSPDLEQDRKGRLATTPRNLGSSICSPDLSGPADAFWRPDYSPQATASMHRKRLSLVSNGASVQDQLQQHSPRPASSLSRCSSLVSESGNMSVYRSPRFNYLPDKTTASSGPNESAAAKRLSYMSNSSLTTASYDTRSPAMRNSSIVSSTFSPPRSSAQTYSAATSPQSRATKCSSIIPPNSIFAQMDTLIANVSHTEPADPLSLLSIKSKFEWMHRARRRWLSHVLALPLTTNGNIMLSNGASLPADQYWTAASCEIATLTSTFAEQDKATAQMVAKEMGTDFINALKIKSVDKHAASRSESRNGLLTVPAGESSIGSIVAHPGLEDRLHTMMLSLRSLQSKIRVCAEEIRVKVPPGLHGINDENAGSEQATSASALVDEATSIIQLEKTLESMRDDLLSLSSEWEATVKLVHKEKRRSPSPVPSTTDMESDVATKLNAARDLESPLEPDEDKKGDANRVDRLSSLSERDAEALEHVALSDDEDDSDLAQLLLSSTSPNSLPPPGLEQVFESIAGIARLSGLGVGVEAKNISRAERIQQTKRQRQLDQEKGANDKASHRHTMDSSGIMSELSDVISSRKVVREQRHRSPLPPTAADSAFVYQPEPEPEPEPESEPLAEPALALGSPLDLDPAAQQGVFGPGDSFSEDQAVPRGSLSSLDLARARALQSLQARSPSVASCSTWNSFDGDDSQPRLSDDFSFEPTALESVPEDAGSTALLESRSAHCDSTSRKSTPKASHASLGMGDATPVPDSPFDWGAQVAAYARRKAAAKAQAEAVAIHASASESSMQSYK
ncbi:hypothetical protein NDA14_002844 [Ustilago hordei]|nr:hypothetical protein NDA14_002844 [Ustilago hordei]